MKNWRLAILVGAATAAATAGVAVAADGSRDGDRDGRTAATMVAHRGRDEAAAGGPGAALRGLLQDPEFREDLWTLRDRQQQALRAWWDEYGDDPTSDEARDARDELRDAQRSALQDLMEKYGVERPDAAAGGSAAIDLMGDPAFREELWALQDETEAAVEAWWDEHGDDPTSDEARAALQKVREEQRASLDELAQKYGVDLGGRALLGRGGPLGGDLLGGELFGAPIGRGLGHGGRDGVGGAPGGWDDQDVPGTDSSSATGTSVTL